MSLILKSKPIVIEKIPMNRPDWVMKSNMYLILETANGAYSVQTSSTLSNSGNSFHGDEYLPTNMFNKFGNRFKEWMGELNGQSAWIIIEYPEATQFNYLLLKATYHSLSSAPSKFEIRGSNNSLFIKDNYDILAEIDHQNHYIKRKKEYKFDNHKNYKHY